MRGLTSRLERELCGSTKLSIGVVVCGGGVGNGRSVKAQGERSGSHLVADGRRRLSVGSMGGRSRQRAGARTCGCCTWLSTSWCLGGNRRNVGCRPGSGCCKSAKGEKSNIAIHCCRYGSLGE